MRRIAVILVSAVLICSAGCKPVDVLFGLFGSNAYTGYGTTTDEKKADFERQGERAKGQSFP